VSKSRWRKRSSAAKKLLDLNQGEMERETLSVDWKEGRSG